MAGLHHLAPQHLHHLLRHAHLLRIPSRIPVRISSPPTTAGTGGTSRDAGEQPGDQRRPDRLPQQEEVHHVGGQVAQRPVLPRVADHHRARRRPREDQPVGAPVARGQRRAARHEQRDEQRERRAHRTPRPRRARASTRRAAPPDDVVDGDQKSAPSSASRSPRSGSCAAAQRPPSRSRRRRARRATMPSHCRAPGARRARPARDERHPHRLGVDERHRGGHAGQLERGDPAGEVARQEARPASAATAQSPRGKAPQLAPLAAGGEHRGDEDAGEGEAPEGDGERRRVGEADQRRRPADGQDGGQQDEPRGDARPLAHGRGGRGRRGREQRVAFTGRGEAAASARGVRKRAEEGRVAPLLRFDRAPAARPRASRTRSLLRPRWTPPEERLLASARRAAAPPPCAPPCRRRCRAATPRVGPNFASAISYPMRWFDQHRRRAQELRARHLHPARRCSRSKNAVRHAVVTGKSGFSAGCARAYSIA